MPPDHLTGDDVVNEYGNRMADLARQLRSQKSTVLTLQHVVTATAEMVKNCDDVSVTTVQAGVVETRAALREGLAERADELQQELGEGPSIDTAWNTPIVTAGALPEDGQWPRWSVAVAEELDIRSLVCVQLYTHENHALGALQLFSREPHAFDAEAIDEVTGIAAHAAVALGAVANLESMQFGLVRRTMIGQATGMLMERYGLDPHQAFEVLRRTSQETGRKVYDLAIDLVNGKKPSGL